MVAAAIFLLHFVAAVYAFLTYRKESLGEGFLAVGFMLIIFAVGWTVATMLTNLLFTPEWFVKWYYQPLESHVWYLVRKELNRDTISLVILTAGEAAFYWVFLGVGRTKQTPPGPTDPGLPKAEEK